MLLFNSSEHMRFFLIFIIIQLSLALQAQNPIGTWEDQLPYQDVKIICAGNEEIFAATDHAIIVFNKKYNEARKLSTVHGLTEYGISAIDFSEESESLVIVYSSTNLDIYKNGRITNIPDVYNNYIAGKKVISRVKCRGNYAYLISSFGIVLLDIDKAEIYDTWNPSLDGSRNEVFDITFAGNNIYAATSQGLLYADANNTSLTYFGNWSRVPDIPAGKIYSDLETIDNTMFLVKPASGNEGDSLLSYDSSILNTIRFGTDKHINSINRSDDKLTITYESKVEIISKEGTSLQTYESYDWGDIHAKDATSDNNLIYIADKYSGLVVESDNGDLNSIIVPGPYYNIASSLFAANGNVYVSGGVLDNVWNNTGKVFNAHFFENRRWWSSIYNDSWDVMRIRPYPGNPDKIAISTWGSGLYILDSHEITHHYDDSNSPLQTIIPGAKYVRICGLAFDSDMRLWLTQTEVESSIKVLNPDGSWLVMPYTIDAPTIGDIIITQSGKKWIILPRGHGLFVLDDNYSPENFGDDRWLKVNVKDQDGKTLNNVSSICEDLDGNIWIGTNQGPAVYYNPDLIFDEDIECYRIKIPRNDGSGLADYLLGTETINTIAVDGGNSLWFGTNSSGVFHLSSDGRELIAEYNTNNSPIISNSITSIAIEEKSGEVWIGTDKGIITLRGNAISGSNNFEKVYAFPNPVRPEYEGSVTISGLVRNTKVKFTDISGNLVFETTSNGGQASWDLTTYNGKRVNTGVYLAFCSSEDGSESTIVKILIIR